MTGIHILRVPTEEVHRSPDGERWCFVCRKRRDFEFVVTAPLIDPDVPLDAQAGAYYGPTPRIECSVCKKRDSDIFPGLEREWEE